MPQPPKYNLPPIDLGNESIGSRIKRFRKERGLTQADLAEQIGIDRQLVSHYENGRLRIYDELVARFAIALKITTDELLGLTQVGFEAEPAPSLRIMRRLKEIDQLPEQKKKAILKTLDDLIKANS